MDAVMAKPRKGIIVKTWERCISIGRNDDNKRGTSIVPSIKRTEAERDKKHARKRQVAPDGCFSVYVGPEKQRFVIKTEYVNHPLFQILLEEAESEYGYNSKGPLALPCNVDLFYKVLVELDYAKLGHGCGFKRKHNSYHNSYRLLSPTRIVSMSV